MLSFIKFTIFLCFVSLLSSRQFVSFVLFLYLFSGRLRTVMVNVCESFDIWEKEDQEMLTLVWACRTRSGIWWWRGGIIRIEADRQVIWEGLKVARMFHIFRVNYRPRVGLYAPEQDHCARCGIICESDTSKVYIFFWLDNDTIELSLSFQYHFQNPQN